MGKAVWGDAMKKYFHGANKTGPYFEGWYFKCRTKDGKALALIPALHIDAANRRSASIQVITESQSWWVEYPASELHALQDRFCVQLGSSTFTDTGMSLEMEQPEIALFGQLRFGPMHTLRTDIMGPFRYFSNMECAHGVISMAHALYGQLTLNGEIYDFDSGTGYVETDRGRAFPSAYLWAQCAWSGGELMLSVARIPFAGLQFTGCICALIFGDKEYRLATYRGVRVLKWSERGAAIRQGKYRLEVELLEENAQPLRAPVDGSMRRTIHESLCTKLRCRFWERDTLLFDETDSSGSFEYSRLPLQ